MSGFAGGTVPWKDIPEIPLAEHYRLCFNKYDKRFMRPIPKSTCPYARTCKFHHTMRGLKAPPGYTPNPKLPDGTPQNFQYVCCDWGSGHELQPRLMFQQEDTWPTRVTQMVQKIVDGDRKWTMHKPSEIQEGIWGKLCYNFTFFGKCIHWTNCLFVHATEEALKREFKMWPCMCANGPRGAKPCALKLCPYPHSPVDMQVPKAFTTPAYKEYEHNIERELGYKIVDSSGGEIAETVTVLQKHIADTPRHGGAAMCQYLWCNDADCRRGVHLLPSAWIEGTPNLPKIPGYFARLLPRPASPIKLAPWAKGAPSSKAPPKAPPKAPAKAPPKAAAPPSPAQAAALLRAPQAAAGHGYPNTPKAEPVSVEDTANNSHSSATRLSVLSDDISAAAANEGSDSPQPENDFNDWDVELSANPPYARGGSRLQDAFLDLLDMGPPSYSNAVGEKKLVEFKKAKLQVAPADELEHIREMFDGGLSVRYRGFFQDWLESGQLQRTYLDTVGVVTHPNLIIGRGAFAELRLGIVKADGRDVALKIFSEQRDADSQFKDEVRALKKHSRLSGTVQYFSSFEESYDTDEGITKFRKVIVLELMEGSLADVIANQRQKADFDPVRHMQLVRYVAGSLLLTLSQLNYGRTENLVHRDVKPDNIMVDRDRYIRLIDFGTSRVIAKHKDSRTLSVGLPMVHLYASPEASNHDPKAHRTSDLYSLGIVIRAALRRECYGVFPVGENSTVHKEIPSGWPSHQTYACSDLLAEMTKAEPRRRAYYDLLEQSQVMTPHQLTMGHPFFWTARTSVKFLIALGNCETAPFPDLNDAIRQSYAPDDSWFPHVEELEQDGIFATPDKSKSDPFKLLKFIRNKYVHKNDRSMESNMRKLLNDRPIFLEKFPRLVTDCWKSMLPFLDDIFSSLSPLQDFYGRSFDVDLERRIVDSKEWL